MDAGLLHRLARWLRRDKDGSLPNIALRTSLYKILNTLQVTEDQLENSQIGKTLMKYWQHDDETAANKKLLSSILEKWMRPMLRLSTDYSTIHEIDEERMSDILHRKKLLDSQPKPINYNPKRARIPEPAKFDYAYRPQAHKMMRGRDEAEEEDEAKEVGAKKPQETKRTQMTKKMDLMNRASKIAKPRFKVDITGRSSTGV